MCKYITMIKLFMLEKVRSSDCRTFPLPKLLRYFFCCVGVFLHTWRKLHSSKNRVLSNKEHFAEFHYRSIICSQKWNMIFEEEVINHSVITVVLPGL